MTTTTATLKHVGIAGGSCPDCGHFIAVDGDAKSAKCPNCSARVALTYVQGFTKDGVPCDDACQYAVGKYCGCSCGGRNHRRGYIRVEMVPAWVRKRDADRHAAKVARRETKAAKARQTAAEAVAEQMADHPELSIVVGPFEAYEALVGYSDFTSDMRMNLLNGRALTPGQLEATVRMLAKATERRARETAWKVEREAAAADKLARGVKCPTGRQSFDGKILAVRRNDGQWGVTFSALVEADAGWQVWVNLPSEVLQQNSARKYTRSAASWRDDYDEIAHCASFRGRRIQLTATIEADDSDPLKGRGKRPVGRMYDVPAAAE